MGLFDQIYIEKKIIEKFNIKCNICNSLMFDKIFQSKTIEDFGGTMQDYFLCKKNNEFVLKKLEEPSKKKFWHKYSEEEYSNWMQKNKQFLKIFPNLIENGYWKDEAFLPKNREKIDMGSLPHKYVTIYSNCKNCSNQCIEYCIKFTDGVVQEIKLL